MLPQKISKSRRSEMPFLVFSWWYFPPNIIKIQTNFNNIPGANNVELFKYITGAFLSYCMTDRKILNNQPVQRSKHLELTFSQFNSSVSKFKCLNFNSSSNTFPVCEKD